MAPQVNMIMLAVDRVRHAMSLDVTAWRIAPITVR